MTTERCFDCTAAIVGPIRQRTLLGPLCETCNKKRLVRAKKELNDAEQR